MLDFMGKDGFVWFVGVVEDRHDPEKMGRLRVRALGHHSSDLSKIPTEDLPWAYVMAPTTTSSMHGLGETPHFIVQGSWVLGFFRDEEKQQPIILGTLPGLNTELADTNKGFNDPEGVYPLQVGINDVSKLSKAASAEFHPSVQLRRYKRETSVPLATKPRIPDVSNTLKTDPVRETWDERVAKSNTASFYPFNHVHESEIGHVHEIDDTPGAARIHRQHAIGTFEEWHPDGARVVHTMHDNYEIISGDNNIFIHKRQDGGGDLNITVEGNCCQYIKGDYTLEVEGNFTQKIHKNKQIHIGAGGAGNKEEAIEGSHSYLVNQSFIGAVGIAEEDPKDFQLTVGGNSTWNTTGNLDIHTDANLSIFAMKDTTMSTVENLSLTTVSGIMSFLSLQNKLNMKSAKAMNLKTEADGLTITSLDFSTWNSTGLVTEVFSASQITGITGSLDLDTSAGMDIDAGANIDIDSTANINLNEGS